MEHLSDIYEIASTQCLLEMGLPTAAAQTAPSLDAPSDKDR